MALNLSDPMFKGIYREKVCHPNDLKLVLQRALNCNVQSFLLTGTNYESSRQVLSIASSTSSYSTAGIHPTHSREFERDFPSIRELITSDRESHQRRIFAIGECGLDYDRLQFAGKEEQMLCFEKHFELTQSFNLPMFLHLRAADSDFLEILRRNRSKFTTGVVHSFDSSINTLNALLEMDLYIGINGCSLKTADNLKVVKEIPLDRLLIETDAPWCDIRPSHASFSHITANMDSLKTRFGIPSFKSFKKEKFEIGETVKSRNEPCNLAQILCVIASVKGIDPGLVADAVWENSKTFLGLDEISPFNSNFQI